MQSLPETLTGQGLLDGLDCFAVHFHLREGALANGAGLLLLFFIRNLNVVLVRGVGLVRAFVVSQLFSDVLDQLLELLFFGEARVGVPRENELRTQRVAGDLVFKLAVLWV